MTVTGRWQLRLFDALAQAELVGVAAAVDRHLGRRATRVELTAAARTAARLARDGRLILHQVRVPPGQYAWRTVPGGCQTRRHRGRGPVAAGRPRPHPRRSDSAAVEEERRTTARHAHQVAVRIEHAAVAARHVDVDHLAPVEEAARLAEQLTAALSEITGLQRRLRRRAQHAGSKPAGGASR